MRCYICDNELHEVKLDDDLKTLPCDECQEAIDDTLADFEDNEEELTDEDLVDA